MSTKEKTDETEEATGGGKKKLLLLVLVILLAGAGAASVTGSKLATRPRAVGFPAVPSWSKFEAEAPELAGRARDVDQVARGRHALQQVDGLLRRFVPGQSALNSGNHTGPKIHRIRLAHPYWPPLQPGG